MFNSKSNLESRRDRKPVEYDEAAQYKYSAELDEQIRFKNTEKDRAKKEDHDRDEAESIRALDNLQLVSDKAQKKHATNAQYFKDLQEQVADNAQRKKQDFDLESMRNWPNNDLFSGMDKVITEDEKRKNQMELKQGLDEMISEKRKLEEMEKEEKLKFENELKELWQSYEQTELENKRLQKEKCLKMQQEFQDFSTRIKEEISKREKEIQKAVDYEQAELSSLKDARVDDMKSAQNKLRDATYRGWEDQIGFHSQQKAKERSCLQEEANQTKQWNDQLDHEDEVKRQAKIQANKQYQRDLMEQINSDKKKHHY